jgi:hypothetical protein
MLNSVPQAINRAARQVTLRHPQSFDCIVSRERVVRVELNDAGGLSESAGLPTLGGMGVLRSEDEADFEYDELGPAKLLFAGPGPFQPMDMNERDSALIAENAREVVIESIAEPGAAPDKPQYFQADTGDLVVLTMGMGVALTYEVATVSGTVALPPYTRKLVLNPRDDLSYVEPMLDD